MVFDQTIHGGYMDKLYDTWQDMKMKCSWPEHRLYKKVGAKGVTVCDAWLDDYAAFRAFALDSGYVDGMYLHRHNIHGNFEPNNVYFSHSKPGSKYLTYNGQTKTQAEWARDRDIKQQTLSKRLKSGWSVGEALGFDARF